MKEMQTKLYDNLLAASEVAIQLTEKQGGKGPLTEQFHFFMYHAQDIMDFISSQTTHVSRVYIENESQLTQLLPIYLLTSETTVIQFSNNYVDKNKKKTDFFNQSDSSPYLASLEGTSRGFCRLNYAPPIIFHSLVADGDHLFKTGQLYLIPTVDAGTWDGDIEFAGSTKKAYAINERLNKICPVEDMKSATSIRDIMFPLIAQIETSDLLKLIGDNRDAFERCKSYLLHAEEEMHKVTGKLDAERKLKKIKNEIIEDGISGLNDRYNLLKRKGIIDAVGANIVSASLLLSSTLSNDLTTNIINTLGCGAHGLATIHNYIQYKKDANEILSSNAYFLTKIFEKT